MELALSVSEIYVFIQIGLQFIRFSGQCSTLVYEMPRGLWSDDNCWPLNHSLFHLTQFVYIVFVVED